MTPTDPEAARQAVRFALQSGAHLVACTRPRRKGPLVVTVALDGQQMSCEIPCECEGKTLAWAIKRMGRRERVGEVYTGAGGGIVTPNGFSTGD